MEDEYGMGDVEFNLMRELDDEEFMTVYSGVPVGTGDDEW